MGSRDDMMSGYKLIRAWSTRMKESFSVLCWWPQMETKMLSTGQVSLATGEEILIEEPGKRSEPERGP